jgi:hypothetical protein
MPTYYRFDGVVRSPQGEAVPGVLVYVCTQPATTSTIPPSPLATIYADSVGTALANPVTVDGNGNFFFYAASGTYTILYFDPNGRVQTTVFPDQLLETPGAGTVTSIALTMPAEFSVAGSPINTSGTFAVTKANQNAGTVYAGPASGPAAAPTFQSLATLAAALGLGTGTVSSVNASIIGSTLLSLSLAGIRSSLAGRSLYGQLATKAHSLLVRHRRSGPVTARSVVAADIFGITAVAFSATPVFDASTFAFPTLTITLTGNVTSSSITNPTAGQIITFIITQDGTGGRTFAYPSNVKCESAIGTDASSVSVQSFIYTGSLWRATGPGSVNAT